MSSVAWLGDAYGSLKSVIYGVRKLLKRFAWYCCAWCPARDSRDAGEFRVSFGFAERFLGRRECCDIWHAVLYYVKWLCMPPSKLNNPLFCSRWVWNMEAVAAHGNCEFTSAINTYLQFSALRLWIAEIAPNKAFFDEKEVSLCAHHPRIKWCGEVPQNIKIF